MKRILVLAGMLLCAAAPGWAQKTTISATVHDPNGIPYSNATLSGKLVGSTGTPKVGQQLIPSTFGPVALNLAGSFSLSVYSNTAITPINSQWQIQVCELPGVAPPLGPGQVCFTAPPITITGASQSITTQLNAAAGSLISFSISAAAGVASLNALTGAVTLSAGANITLTPAGNNIAIASTGGGSTININGAPVGSPLNFNGTAPVADVNFIALTWKVTGLNAIVEGPIGNTSTTFAVGSDVRFPSGGTLGFLSKYSAPTTLVNSCVDDSATTPTVFTVGCAGGMAVAGANAGFAGLQQGAAQGITANVIGLTAPVAVTGYNFVLPGAAGTGLFRGDNAANIVTTVLAELSGAVVTSGSNATVLATKYQISSCQPGLGDGLNAIAAGTYLMTTCGNEFGATVTITEIRCFTDNNGTSTLDAANAAATGLLTGPVTCTNSKNPLGAAGTPSGTTTLVSGDSVSFTFVADGTSKQVTFVLTVTR